MEQQNDSSNLRPIDTNIRSSKITSNKAGSLIPASGAQTNHINQRSGATLQGKINPNERQPLGSRQSQTGGASGSQHLQQSSILMNSGGLAMQNLAVSNSESKKMQQQKNSMTMMEKNKSAQNQNFSGRYQGNTSSIQNQQREQEMTKLLLQNDTYQVGGQISPNKRGGHEQLQKFQSYQGDSQQRGREQFGAQNAEEQNITSASNKQRQIIGGAKPTTTGQKPGGMYQQQRYVLGNNQKQPSNMNQNYQQQQNRNTSVPYGQRQMTGQPNNTASSGTGPGMMQGRAAGTYNQVSSNGIVRKKVENLPRTGIEYPLMRDLGHAPFITNQKEFEPLCEKKISESMLEEYMRNDADRSVNVTSTTSFPVVYDYLEQSPYYEGENAKYGPYIDEKDLIELPNPSDQGNGSINEPYQKRYYFNPQNLPYSLEQSHQYGQVQNQHGSSITAKRSNAHGPRLNRYYEKLKPYYRVDQEKVEEPSQGQTSEETIQQALPSDKTLVFESRFESGNLRKVMKVNTFEYEMFLKNDYSTQSFCQWYYFRIQNTRKDQTYRFHLVNFMKPDSTYNKGMRPLTYSLKDADVSKNGWTRDCFNIAYYQTGRLKKAYKNQNSSQFRGNQNFYPYAINNASSTSMQPSNDGYGSVYYCLTFEWTAKHDNDTVYFSHCYPYTYTDLCRFVSKTCTFQNKDKVRKTVLCKSLAGNDVDMLIVTNFASIPEEIAVRKAVILTARVHPGESNASYMMQGVIEYLVSDDEKAQFLRDSYVFKIIPMLNPDGVIVGNYRCSLVGQDLNRQWIGSSAKLYPINYHTKLMMKKTQESREIFFFCDFHGHSTGRNVFMYGNSQTRPSDRLKERIFPMLFSENTDNFSFEDCAFAVHKSKESCGRIVMWREFNLINSYTCEASFCGPTKGVHESCHFNANLLENIGKTFCRTMVDMTENKDRMKRVMQDLQIRYPINAPIKKGYADDDE